MKTNKKAGRKSAGKIAKKSTKVRPSRPAPKPIETERERRRRKD